MALHPAPHGHRRAHRPHRALDLHAAPLIRAGHERFDGGGYPDGLRADEIPLGARIIAVCDAFDAMITDRAYRSGVSVPAALAELRRCAGPQVDADVVNEFCALAPSVVGGAAAARV